MTYQGCLSRVVEMVKIMLVRGIGIRDMLYPVDDFRQLTQREVSKIARLLNERPRKTLDFRTPYEVFSELR
jgi:hypothetical protein